MISEFVINDGNQKGIVEYELNDETILEDLCQNSQKCI